MNLKEILHEILNIAAGPGARQDVHDAIDAVETVGADVVKDAPVIEQAATSIGF